MLNWQKWILRGLSAIIFFMLALPFGELAFDPAHSEVLMSPHRAALYDLTVSDWLLVFLALGIVGSFTAFRFSLNVVFAVLVGGAVLTALLALMPQNFAAIVNAPIHVIVFGLAFGILVQSLFRWRTKAQA